MADAFITAGLSEPMARIWRSQAQLDQGKIDLALRELRAVRVGVKRTSRAWSEAVGLIGRAHKQLYIDSGGAQKAALEGGFAAYSEGWKVTRDLWHRVNMLALGARAERDGVALEKSIDVEKVARKIVDRVSRAFADPSEGPRIPMWDRGSALEAAVALGERSEVERWLERYLTRPRDGSPPDAFELASTSRQLVEVWQLTTDGAHGWLLTVLDAALLAQTGGSVRVRDIAHRIRDLRPAPHAAWGQSLYTNVETYRAGLERASAVARLERSADGAPRGTGFLVKGSELSSKWGDAPVLLTNAHVLDWHEDSHPLSIHPSTARARFEGAGPPLAMGEPLWRSPVHQLDTVVLRLPNPPETARPLPLASSLPPVGGAPRVYVIGHPAGAELVFSLHDSVLVHRDDRVLHYRTPTIGGSSGSPIFDRQWNLVGIHHAGTVNHPIPGGPADTYEANEGLAIRAVREAIA